MGDAVMRSVWVPFVLALTGCLSFDPPSGRLACDTVADCPADFVCSGGRCVNERTPLDAGTDASPDAGTVEDSGMEDAGVDDGGIECTDDPCRLIAPQCGCTAGRACYTNGGSSMCLAVGSTPERELCNGQLNACEPGMLCATSGTSQICIRLCEANSDCTGGPGSFCAKDLSADLHACSFSCDLVAQDCPEGFRCEPGSVPSEPGLRTATDCTPITGSAAGDEGDACSSFRDCMPGLTCGSGQCLRFCAFGSVCESGGTCSELSPGIRIGGTEYGACPPP
ncbi:MAG: hypothetical protein R3B99_16470 [Polyangiales bacterium]